MPWVFGNLLEIRMTFERYLYMPNTIYNYASSIFRNLCNIYPRYQSLLQCERSGDEVSVDFTPMQLLINTHPTDGRIELKELNQKQVVRYRVGSEELLNVKLSDEMNLGFSNLIICDDNDHKYNDLTEEGDDTMEYEITNSDFKCDKYKEVRTIDSDDEDLKYYSLEEYPFEEGDIVIEFSEEEPIEAQEILESYTMYKRVDKKVKPVPGVFPEESRVQRKVPKDPMLTLPKLPTHPPEFEPSERLTKERMEELNVNKDGFLWPEEEKLFKYILV